MSLWWKFSVFHIFLIFSIVVRSYYKSMKAPDAYPSRRGLAHTLQDQGSLLLPMRTPYEYNGRYGLWQWATKLPLEQKIISTKVSSSPRRISFSRLHISPHIFGSKLKESKFRLSRRKTPFFASVVENVEASDSLATNHPRRELPNGVEIETGAGASECKIDVNVTIPAKMVKATLNKVVSTLSQNVSIPGFRKTKKKTAIPQDIIIGAIGTHVVNSKATETLIENTIWDALAEVKDEALPKSERISLVDRRHSVMQHVQEKKNFRYSVTVEVVPQVRWKVPYSEMKVKVGSKDPETEFNMKILKMRKRFGITSSTSSNHRLEALVGDIATISYKIHTVPEEEGEESTKVFAALGKDIAMKLFRRVDGTEVSAVTYDPQEDGNLMPGVHEALLGMKEGDVKTTTIEIPEDWEVSSARGVKATIELQMEMLRRFELKELDDSLAPWLASGATKLDVALSKGLEETREEIEREEKAQLYDAITAAVAGNVDNELPERLLYQTAVQLYMDSLPKQRGLTHDIESAPTLVEKYINQNYKKIESAARARLGLRAIADAEKLTPDESEVRSIAEKSISMRPKDNEMGDEEKIEETKEWRSAKHTLEMDAAVDWVKSNVELVRSVDE
eukprot:jgi/Bigna1/71029/fgenesh1_pg.14_\